jgi:porin
VSVRRLVTVLLAVTACPGAWTVRAQDNDTLPWTKWDYATGDWDGNRKVWSDRGVDVVATYTAQVWGNPVGGLQSGAAYVGLLQFGLEADLGKAVGWRGGSFHTTWLWLSGGQPSANNVGSLFAVSAIEGPPSFRALDLWLQQEFHGGALSLRAGLFNADAEFTVSENASLFQNSGFGWPIAYGAPLGGPPVYPYAAPGIYAAVEPGAGWKFQAAAMQAESGGPGVNRNNFYWRLDSNDGFLLLGEARRAWEASRLPATAKIGVIFDTGSKDFDGAGGNDWGGGFVYGILDRMLWREDGPGDPQGAGGFVRGGFALSPGDQLAALVNAGITYTGLLPGRDEDTVGCAVCWAELGADAADQLDGGNRGREWAIELTYQAQITPWFTLQPDVQYIIQPGASTALGNALVVGLSAAVAF